jgi:hypothetical protein
MFLFEFDPIFEDHFEFLEDEGVGESVATGVGLDEVVFVGVVFLDGAVEADADPGCGGEYQ